MERYNLSAGENQTEYVWCDTETKYQTKTKSYVACNQVATSEMILSMINDARLK